MRNVAGVQPQGVLGPSPGRVGTAAGTVLYHPPGPVRNPAGSLPVQDLADCRLLANKGEIKVIFTET